MLLRKSRSNGTHDHRPDTKPGSDPADGISCWTNGFWGGMMWLMHHETGNQKYKDISVHSEKLFDECFLIYYGLHHDVGFMWLPTSVATTE